MKLKILIPVGAMCLTTFIQAEIRAPKAGVIRYADGSIRTVYGLEKNFVTGERIASAAEVASFSDSGGIVGTQDGILLVGTSGVIFGEYHSSGTHPILNIDADLTTAVAYLPPEHLLVHWTGASFSAVRVATADLYGTVTSVRLPDAHSAELLETTSDGNVSEVTMSLDTGVTTSVKLLPVVKGPAYLYHSFVLFQDKQGLEIEAPNGSRRTVPLPKSDFALEPMSSELLHISSKRDNRSWALHLDAASTRLSELPGAALHESKR